MTKKNQCEVYFSCTSIEDCIFRVKKNRQDCDDDEDHKYSCIHEFHDFGREVSWACTSKEAIKQALINITKEMEDENN